MANGCFVYIGVLLVLVMQLVYQAPCGTGAVELRIM